MDHRGPGGERGQGGLNELWAQLGVGVHHQQAVIWAQAGEDAGGALLAVLREPTAWAAWARDAGLDPKHGTARRARDRLCEQGAIAQGTDGLWGHADGEVA